MIHDNHLYGGIDIGDIIKSNEDANELLVFVHRDEYRSAVKKRRPHRVVEVRTTLFGDPNYLLLFR